MVDSLSVKTNGHRERRDFAKITTQVGIPDLIEIQKRSYERFLQKDVSPERREDIGLQSALPVYSRLMIIMKPPGSNSLIMRSASLSTTCMSVLIAG